VSQHVTTLLLQSVPYILSLLQSVSVRDLLLQSVDIGPIAVCACHNPSSAVRTYYPYCSLCLYMTFFCSLYILSLLQSVSVRDLLLQSVDIGPTLQSVHVTTLLLQSVHIAAICTYCCSLCLYMTFCSPYILSILQCASVHDPSSAVCTK
jgi:hypothetical protein